MNFQDTPTDNRAQNIVEVTNPTDFDFTPELGAMYDGNALFLGKGETRMFPFYIGRRLALNLAKQIFLKGAKTEKDKKPKDMPLWDADTLANKADELMKFVYKEEKPIAKDEHQELMDKVRELQSQFEEFSNEEQPVTARTKKDVIAELEEKEIDFDSKKSKAELEKLLEE